MNTLKKIVLFVSLIFFVISTLFLIANNSNASNGIPEGALIRASGDIDVYIVKYVGSKKFKRLILSPHVFNSYGHLHWEDVMDVGQSVVDSFTTSNLVRAAVAGDPKVFMLYPAGDAGEKRWIPSVEIFNSWGFDWDSIYTINEIDRDAYIVGTPIEADETADMNEILREYSLKYFGGYHNNQDTQRAFELGCNRTYYTIAEYAGAIASPTHEIVISGIITCPESTASKSLEEFISELNTPLLAQLVGNGEQFDYLTDFISINSQDVYYEQYGSSNQNDERKLYLFKNGGYFVLTFYVCKPCGIKVLDNSNQMKKFVEDLTSEIRQ